MCSPHDGIRINKLKLLHLEGFLDSSAGKESTCNAGDPSLIPGSVRSSGEGIGYPLQNYWASLVAQLIENLPAMWETWVRSLGWENLWRRESLPTLVFLPGKSHGQRSLVGYSPWGCKKSDMTEWLNILHLESITNLILLYNSGNYIQSYGINQNGKEY